MSEKQLIRNTQGNNYQSHSICVQHILTAFRTLVTFVEHFLEDYEMLHVWIQQVSCSIKQV